MRFRTSPLVALSALPLIALGVGALPHSVRVAEAAASVPVPMSLDGHLLVESVGGGATSQKRTLSSPAEVHTGDRLVFLIRYRNQGRASLHGYDFVSPVPHGVRILPDRSDMVRISADGGRSWTRPDSPLRIDASGKLRAAGDLAPTHVRLRLDRRIAPGEAGTVAYRGLLL